ncbi:MAG: hypothetical protein F4066_01255 [Chloroflexi bacterium]|nr:hypothetical protein [Chloroflexota bacterium]MYI03477.1 hypothetical protein [Chloroflexota bacterium]
MRTADSAAGGTCVSFSEEDGADAVISWKPQEPTFSLAIAELMRLVSQPVSLQEEYQRQEHEPDHES